MNKSKTSRLLAVAAAAALAFAIISATTIAAGTLTSVAATPSASPSPSSSPTPLPTSTPTGYAAVRAVVQKATQEQEKAFALNDSTPMLDTATDAYYAELVRTDAALRSGGVTAIQLLSVTFDEAIVQGNAAQVITSETWQATFADGSITVDTSVNIYALVKSGGVWLINSDTQPSPNIPPSTNPGGTGPATVGAKSRNWSGYVASGGTFTGVRGTWTVPTVAPTGTSADATWVGIGGATTTDLVQAGTQAVVNNGVVHYDAWIETLPQASQPVPLTIAAGDTVTVSITQQSVNFWGISMTDVTSGGSWTGTVQYTSSVSSAEWIQEAPSTGKGVVVLDQFGTLQFTNTSTVMNGTAVTPAAAHATAVTMVNRKTGVTLATPSALGPDGTSFSVARS
ncbi:MAG TPA: G1 family glutamic endopeptidase [Methylomirabilota bacterium]|nr:G1 family glutamic endopeptidase [Methylomirabilota bacterium]